MMNTPKFKRPRQGDLMVAVAFVLWVFSNIDSLFAGNGVGIPLYQTMALLLPLILRAYANDIMQHIENHKSVTVNFNKEGRENETRN